MPGDPYIEAEVERLLGLGLVQDSEPPAPSLISAVGLQVPKTNWLWEGYLQAMKLANIEAAGSGGKTRLSLGISACGSVGCFPFGYTMEPWHCEPFNTVIFSSEDEPAEIAQTFEECGGDRRRLFIYSPQEHGPLTLDEGGIERVRDLMLHADPKLIIFDPILEYAPESVKTQNDNSGITHLLAALRRLAVTDEVCICNVRHWAKGLMGKEMHELAAGGSAWRNGARGQFVIFPHPDNDTGIGAHRDRPARFLVCSARNSNRVVYGGPFEIVIDKGIQTFVPPDQVDITPYANAYQAVRNRYNITGRDPGTYYGTGKRGPSASSQAKAAEAITAYLKENGPTHYRKLMEAMRGRIADGNFAKNSVYRARQVLIDEGVITDIEGTWGLTLDNATLEGDDPFASPDDPDEWRN